VNVTYTEWVLGPRPLSRELVANAPPSYGLRNVPAVRTSISAGLYPGGSAGAEPVAVVTNVEPDSIRTPLPRRAV
jgi:hypothetical protein